MLIRRAHGDDAGAVSALIRSLAHFFTIAPDGAGAEQFLASVSEDALRDYFASPRFLYYVAEHEGRLAGVVALRDGSHLYHLFVAPACQGRGHARTLWRHAVATAEQAGTPIATVNATLYAQPMYERFGFVPEGEAQRMHGIAFIPMRMRSPD